MKNKLNTLPIVFVVLALLSFTIVASAQLPLENLPYSGSALMVRAIRNGKIHVGTFSAQQVINPDLTCTPAPCVLPNVDAAPGGSSPTDETPVVVNRKNSQQLLTGANDYNCASIQGFYASIDGGTTWNRTCLNSTSGGGDPVVGYDLRGNSFIGGIDFSGPTIAMEKSTDGGKTWGAPFATVQYLLSGQFADKPWLQIDVNPKSKFANSLYISTTQFDGANDSEITVVAHQNLAHS